MKNHKTRWYRKNRKRWQNYLCSLHSGNLEKMIGFDHPTWQIQDSYELAIEQMAKYKEFAKAHGVKY